MTDAVGTALLLALAVGAGIAGWRSYRSRRLKLAELAEAQLALFEEAFRSFPPNSYIANSEYEEWRSRCLGLKEVKSDPRLAGLLPQVDRQGYLAWLEFVKGGSASIESHNKRFIEATLAADAKAFDRVE